eukprot:149720-Amphidinium_carterae.1
MDDAFLDFRYVICIVSELATDRPNKNDVNKRGIDNVNIMMSTLLMCFVISIFVVSRTHVGLIAAGYLPVCGPYHYDTLSNGTIVFGRS